MNQNIEEKLSAFSSAVLSEAQSIRAAQEEKNNNIIDEKVNKAQDEFLNSAYKRIQEFKSGITKQNNARILSLRNEAKKELIAKREEIINKIFDKVNNKIAEFISSDKYPEWLEDKLKSAIFDAGEGKKLIYITKKDAITVNNVINSLSDNSLYSVCIVDDNSFLGGFKLLNEDKNIFIDCTTDEMTANAKSEFLQKSGLSIE